jgi:hypothetical protein
VTNVASSQRRGRLRVVTCLSLGLFLLSIGAALGASALDENEIVALSVLVAFMLELPTLILIAVWAESRGARAAWIVITLIAVAGIVVTWLIYPVPRSCSLVFGDECPDDPRFQPALIGTIVIAGLWIIGTLLRVLLTSRRPSRVWTLPVNVLLVAAVVYFPVATLGSGGFSIPWW